MRITLVVLLAICLFGCGGDEATGCSLAISDDPSPHTGVVINEVKVKSADGSPDWLEIYNRGAGEADLSCFNIVDKSSKHSPFFIEPGVTLAPGGFYVLRRDKAEGINGFTWGFGNSDTAYLRDGEGRTVDETDWKTDSTTADYTWGRFPDGTGSFAALSGPTDGAPNKAP